MVQSSWFSFYLTYSSLLRFLFSGLPFSIGDIFYLAIGAYLLWELSGIVRIFFRWKLGSPLRHLSLRSLRLLLVLVGLYLLFLGSWGLNYTYRSYIQESKLSVTPQSVGAVDSLSRFLLKKCETEKKVLMQDSASRQVHLARAAPVKPSLDLYSASRTPAAIFDTARDTYLHSPLIYNHSIPGLSLEKPTRISLKPSLYSLAMNYMGVSGYFNPFTGEAQVNARIPETEIPFTTCHEIAHELGYGYEYEANLIGYLVSTSSSSARFRYSGHLQALMYALPELRMRDSVKFRILVKQISPAVLADLRNEIHFWRAYQGATERLISIFYTSYLKANKQPQGMQSYSDLVPLLGSYYKQYGYPKD